MPGSVTQQANDNLQLSAFAIAVIAEGAESVVFAFEISAGHIIEKQALGRPLFFKQDFFDIRLPVCEPIEIGIEIILVKAVSSRGFLGPHEPALAARRKAAIPDR